MNPDENQLTLKDIGEWGTIDRLLPLLEKNVLATNDDAVAVKVKQDLYVVCNTDILVWDTDVPTGMTPAQAGRKVVTMTISDIVAKGGGPDFFLSACLFPPETPVTEFMNMSNGIKEACNKYSVRFLGGDLGEGGKSVTGVGVGWSKRPVPRSGAQPGDLLWATGEFGNTGASFHHLFSSGEPISQMETILKSVYEPHIEPKWHKIIEQVATASIDSSDGLSISLHEIAKESHVRLDVESLPSTDAAERYAKANNMNLRDLVLFSGEEFKIIFTSALSKQKIISLFQQEKLPNPLLLGKVKKGEGVSVKGKNIPRKGWEHFKR